MVSLDRLDKDNIEEFGSLDYEPFRVLREFWHYFLPRMRILILGVPMKYSQVAFFVNHHKFDVYFIDISEYATKKSRRLLITKLGKIPDNIHLVQGDLANTTFDDDFFDLCIVRYLFEHYKPLENLQFLKELHRICKGYVIIGVTTSDVKPEHLEADPTHVTKWTFRQWELFLNSTPYFRVIAKNRKKELFLLEKIKPKEILLELLG